MTIVSGIFYDILFAGNNHLINAGLSGKTCGLSVME
ncbi:MAG: hypothetical protein JWP12_1437 [Bacteroidetes bacterium]|nr:hypothetical protein [Bacteroidota bacterium]